jgi:hypothetical protein
MTSWTYAGEYYSAVLYQTKGPIENTAITITTSTGSAATLYTDATKDTPLDTNVVTTDGDGNLNFFADPGTYTCTSPTGGSFPAVVPVNPGDVGSGGGSGTVTSVAVESANGLNGTVADDTTTPQITLETTVTGVLKGASGAIEAATAGTDYLAPSGSGAALTGITVSQVSGAAPLASPALSGTPTAPTASALTDSTQVATTAYADSAVAVETSRAETAEGLLAPKASPALTGSPTAPTQTSSDNSTLIATDAFVQTAAATAQSNAESYAAGLQPTSGSPLALSKGGTGVSASSDSALLADLGAAPLASPALSGTPTAPTASALTDSTQVATTAYTDSAVAVETSRAETAEALKAPLASPALTGTPTAPTPSGGDSSTKLATTAFVEGALPSSGTPLPLADGGTGVSESTAAALVGALGALLASNNLSDLGSASTARSNLGLTGAATASLPLAISNGGSGTATGAGQNDVFAGPSSGGTGAPSFRSLVAADLPAATTSAQGAVKLDGTAADILADGVQAAGSNGLAADSGHVHPNYAWPSQYLAPSGATAETFPRVFAVAETSASAASGTLYVTAIPMASGIPVNNITLWVDSQAATLADVTHGWYVLLDTSRVVRAVSADQTSGNWNNTSSAVTLSVSGSSYTTTYGGLYYIGYCITISAGSMPRFTGCTAIRGVAQPAPIMQGSSASGYSSAPPSTGSTMGALTALQGYGFYAYTS